MHYDNLILQFNELSYLKVNVGALPILPPKISISFLCTYIVNGELPGGRGERYTTLFNFTYHNDLICLIVIWQCYKNM